jgi:hypothetical protein
MHLLQWESRCSFSHGERWKTEDLYRCEEGRQVWGDEPPQAGDEVLAKDVDDGETTLGDASRLQTPL